MVAGPILLGGNQRCVSIGKFNADSTLTLSSIAAYDFVAGSKHNIGSSYLLSRERALELFPMIRKDKLCGAIVYYDGSHNDARMNISIAITAARLGATIANHVRVVSRNFF